ncbi:M3 family oligoendopeptidase [Erysipelothrix urinaevulpis]|uniref:M3 family oligoendopeptidase n=1 Tax=Erysipelothrix urinaevulpis TaxID=2683717 RepID=UPI001357C0ED|nr:M3 family oligoendopeptidase [Erysipelothrix urinaevulpis]
MYTWSLDDLYEDYNTAFEKDFNTLTNTINTLTEESVNLKTQDDLISFMKLNEDYTRLARNLFSFISLNLATNTNDSISNQKYAMIANLVSTTAKPFALFNNFVYKNKDSITQWIQDDAYLKEHEFLLNEIIARGKHQLSDEIEDVIAKMQINASDAWSKLQSQLTANATIEFNGDTHTLTSIRNFAYDPSQEIRREAYLKELELYKTIEDAVAFSLNSIKGEVNTINDLRGYENSLEKTLQDSRLSKESLDALFVAMNESMPIFRKYLKHKGSLLGHDNGLPWYDLFAPIGQVSNTKYSIEDSKKMIVESFNGFSEDLGALALRAYDEKWIDFLPREGKRGGAFCSNLPQIKQSRVMTNFDGSMSGIVTIAHELGHAYHGHMIEDLSLLNTSYTMPVAETASTFCENIVFNEAMKTASPLEQQMLIENSISDLCQIIVDISSRYYFEEEVFNRRKNEFLSSDDLKKIMIDAQLKTYGDGLDPDTLHPYMWVCKGHYYSGGLSYYNFPYAFGGLFALGLYAQFQERGEDFVPQYRKLLEATTTQSCENVALMAGIDITQPDFWRSSLKVAEERINDFIALTSK